MRQDCAFGAEWNVRSAHCSAGPHSHWDIGEDMPTFDKPSGETTTPTPDEDGNAAGADLNTEPAAPTPGGEAASSSARMLELAAITADQLVADARTEAETMAAELSRTAAEQRADLDRERTTAMARLADEKADIEAKIAVLREMEADQRAQMRRLLTEQLALLDATRSDSPDSPDSPADGTG